jgi:tRNA A-37 threonylcarbamoyl transferase component Bud32
MNGLFMQPGIAEVLCRRGLRTFNDFFRFTGGKLIGGHRERNVSEVDLGGVRVFLKREYFLPWKDRLHSWWAGFGFVTKSQREWQILKELRARDIPCPEPLALGSQNGKAFLLLREVPGAGDLHGTLHHQNLSKHERTALARLLGKSISDLHAAGYTHPDLYAKHVLVARDRGAVCFVDYQRTQKRLHLGWSRRCRDLAALNASLGEQHVSRRERLHCLFSYLWHAYGADTARSARTARRSLVRAFIRLIEKRTRHLLHRRKVREMRQLDAPGRESLVIEYWRLAVQGLGVADESPVPPPTLRNVRGTP